MPLIVRGPRKLGAPAKQEVPDFFPKPLELPITPILLRRARRRILATKSPPTRLRFFNPSAVQCDLTRAGEHEAGTIEFQRTAGLVVLSFDQFYGLGLGGGHPDGRRRLLFRQPRDSGNSDARSALRMVTPVDELAEFVSMEEARIVHLPGPFSHGLL